MKKLAKEAFIKLIVLGSLLVTFIFLFSIRYIPSVSEFWSKTFSRAYHFVFGHLVSWIPISLFELFVYGSILGSIAWIVLFIIKTKKSGIKQSWPKILTLLIVVFGVATCYTATAGMEYYREPVPVTYQTEVVQDFSFYKELADYYVADMNECAAKMEYGEDNLSKNPYTYRELNKIMKEEFKRLDDIEYYSKYTPNAKAMYLASWLYTELNITGVSFAPTGEPNFNVISPDGDKPFVIAHEICHAKGVMREEDANLVATYICLTSENYYLRYSAYLNTFSSFLEMSRMINNSEDEYNVRASIDRRIYRDLNAIYDFWQQHKLIENISTWFNDLYLRISANEDTTAYIDVPDGEIHEDPGEPPAYIINNYSPYQGLMVYLYQNR